MRQDLAAGTVSFCQERYILDAARRFDLHVDNAWADIPVPLQLARDRRSATPDDAERAEYAEVCGVMGGVITHIATFSRADACFAAQLCASAPPSQVRHRLQRRVLGYLARTASLRVTYRRDAGAAVRMAYIGGEHDGAEATAPYMATDADHGTGRSYTGWLVMLAAAAAGWGVRAQPQPSLSSTEAELYGLSTSVCELLIFANLLEEVGYSI